MEIINYLKINELIQTSGQPKVKEFELIYKSGANTVVNLALPDHKEAISNEGELVTKHGMNYIHIPVVWQSPQPEQYQLFQDILRAHATKSIWVHCALNWRVASFIYLYRTKCLGISESEAKKALLSIWEPNDVWSKFIVDNA
jgi:protein tyrosine phosphatase (PTP) superfamily phosphohydrolase (DUF442 family)